MRNIWEVLLLLALTGLLICGLWLNGIVGHGWPIDLVLAALWVTAIAAMGCALDWWGRLEG